MKEQQESTKQNMMKSFLADMVCTLEKQNEAEALSFSRATSRMV